MRLKISSRLLLSILCVFVSLSLYPQSIKDLENQRKQALQKLQTTNRMLNETQKSKKSSLSKLNIISKSINERKKMIQNINSEISILDNQIQQLNNEKRVLENKLGTLRAAYVDVVRQTRYQQSTYDKLLYVFSAKTFDQSLRRVRYLKEHSEFQKAQVRKMENVKLV